MRGLTAAVVLAGALGVLGSTACGSNSNSSNPGTTTPDPGTTTDTFTGSLTRNGAATHTFITPRAGSVTATLTSLGPGAGLTVGLSLGTWNGNACQIQLAKDNAVQSSYVTGAASAAGNLCVRIYDVGNVLDPVAYQIDVVHP